MKKTVNLSKRMLALVATSVLSCAAFNHQAQATPIEGRIVFSGLVQLDNDDLSQATSVLTWFDALGNNPGHANVIGPTEELEGLHGTLATISEPWVFNPSTPTPGLWSVGDFTFDLLSAHVVSQSSDFLDIVGRGIISGNGFDPTLGYWRFTTGAGRHFFIGVTNTVPDVASTFPLLGFALLGLAALRRKVS